MPVVSANDRCSSLGFPTRPICAQTNDKAGAPTSGSIISLGVENTPLFPTGELTVIRKSTMKKSPTIQLEEISGTEYLDRETAQQAALSSLSENLQAVIQQLLERGVLVNLNGKIIPNPNR